MFCLPMLAFSSSSPLNVNCSIDFATYIPVSLAFGTLKCNVLIPLNNKKQSNGDNTAPPVTLASLILFQCVEVRSLQLTTPAKTSECPFKYFEHECMTKSAPKFNGRHNNGVNTVASTTLVTPFARHHPVTVSISKTCHELFAGVSIHMKVSCFSSSEQSISMANFKYSREPSSVS